MSGRYFAKSRRGGTAENRVVMIRRRKAFAPSPMRVRIYNFLPMKARRCPAIGGTDSKSQRFPVQRFARERESPGLTENAIHHLLAFLPPSVLGSVGL